MEKSSSAAARHRPGSLARGGQGRLGSLAGSGRNARVGWALSGRLGRTWLAGQPGWCLFARQRARAHEIDAIDPGGCSAWRAGDSQRGWLP
jgi:hypothetical protein